MEPTAADLKAHLRRVGEVEERARREAAEEHLRRPLEERLRVAVALADEFLRAFPSRAEDGDPEAAAWARVQARLARSPG